MGIAKAFPPCSRTDCHGYVSGKCRALNTSDFDNGCPFYKTCADYFSNKLIAEKRLKAAGEKNLITQYYGSGENLDRLISDDNAKLNELLAAEKEHLAFLIRNGGNQYGN